MGIISNQLIPKPREAKADKNLQQKLEDKFYKFLMEILSAVEEIDTKMLRSAMDKAIGKVDKDITEYYAKKSEEEDGRNSKVR